MPAKHVGFRDFSGPKGCPRTSQGILVMSGQPSDLQRTGRAPSAGRRSASRPRSRLEGERAVGPAGAARTTTRAGLPPDLPRRAIVTLHLGQISSWRFDRPSISAGRARRSEPEGSESGPKLASSSIDLSSPDPERVVTRRPGNGHRSAPKRALPFHSGSLPTDHRSPSCLEDPDQRPVDVLFPDLGSSKPS